MRRLTLMLKSLINPHAPSNHTTSASAIYRKHELCKKRSYETRIREVEQSSFTPLLEFFQPLEEWLIKQPCFTNALLPCYQINGTQIILL